MKKSRTQREIEKLTAVLRIDPQAGAVYVGLREHLKVARTEVKQEWPLLAVDYAADGRVIGIESVGADQFELKAIFHAAGIRPTQAGRMLANSVIAPAAHAAVATA